MTREHILEGCDQEPHLWAHIGKREQHMVRAGIGQDQRRLDPIVIDACYQAALHQSRIRRWIGADPMKPRLAIEISLRCADLPGKLVVEKSRTIIEPLRSRRFRVWD